MTIHTVPDSVRNSDIEYCIDEYVRQTEYRDILREHWFHGATLEALAQDHDKSLTAIKNIIYNIGDKVLLKADKMKPKTD